jgi:two-component system, chemotaxis family, chemotaxis protein CheY
MPEFEIRSIAPDQCSKMFLDVNLNLLARGLPMEKYDLSELDVLIVDQNQHMLSILRTALHELGMVKIRDTHDPDMAFQMFKDQPPDLIFSDWVPGSDELKFLNKVRDAKQSPSPFIPIIIVTAYSEKPNVLAARDLGMTEFLAAPVSVKAIYDHICSVIKDERTFINEAKFFGPDRRRRKDKSFQGEDRRSEIEPVQQQSKPKSDPEKDLTISEESENSDT